VISTAAAAGSVPEFHPPVIRAGEIKRFIYRATAYSWEFKIQNFSKYDIQDVL
jgi:hypothetical protein